jgi:hypothetical protein
MEKNEESKITITQCCTPDSWYQEDVGKSFVISYTAKNGYMIKHPNGGIKLVKFEDCLKTLSNEVYNTHIIITKILETLIALIPVFGFSFCGFIFVASFSDMFQLWFGEITKQFLLVFKISTFIIGVCFFGMWIDYLHSIIKK